MKVKMIEKTLVKDMNKCDRCGKKKLVDGGRFKPDSFDGVCMACNIGFFGTEETPVTIKKWTKPQEYSEVEFKKRAYNAIRTNFKFSNSHRDCVMATRTQEAKYKKDGSRAKVDQVLFLCAGCGERKPGKAKFEVDHVEPVIEIGKSKFDYTLEEYFQRTQNLPVQYLCGECHTAKSKAENKERRELKKQENKSK
jgi:5-methylcytosine-specific restriction endonuclease McrA